LTQRLIEQVPDGFPHAKDVQHMAHNQNQAGLGKKSGNRTEKAV
jgi:hypothetical protein